MLFLFKRKLFTIDAFVPDQLTGELFPITHASSILPEWWKKIPSTYDDVNSPSNKIKTYTIKKCPGFRDLYTKGFVIPLWSDLVIETKFDGDIRYQFASGSPASIIDSHNRLQFGNYFDNLIHAKISSPWFLSEKTGIKFHFSNPVWNLINVFDGNILPGIIDFKYQHQTNINMFLPKVNQSYYLEAGTPLVHLHPLTEKKVSIKIHCVSADEMTKIHQRSNNHFKFTGSFDTKKRIMDKSITERKCPFSLRK